MEKSWVLEGICHLHLSALLVLYKEDQLWQGTVPECSVFLQEAEGKPGTQLFYVIPVVIAQQVLLLQGYSN